MLPKILYNNILETANSITPSAGTADGYYIDYLRDRRPHMVWLSSGSGNQTITVTMPAATKADTLGICNHNLAGATINFKTTGTTIGSYVVPNNKAFMITGNLQNVTQYIIEINNPSATPFIGALFIGEALEFPCGPVADYIPYSRKLKVKSNESESANIISQYVEYPKYTAAPTFKNVNRSWFKNSYEPFFEECGPAGKMFFYGWDLEHCPDEILYCKFSPDHEHRPVYRMSSIVSQLVINLEGRR